MKTTNVTSPGIIVIYRPWITAKDGRRIYPKHGRAFRLEVPASRYR